MILEEYKKYANTSPKTQKITTSLMTLKDELRDCMYKNPEQFESKLTKALAQGFPIDWQTTKYDNTLLIVSLQDDNAAQMRIPDTLLNNGADVNIATYADNITPLYRAIDDIRPLPLIKRLIDIGADVNAQTAYGRTAFGNAAEGYICGQDNEQQKYKEIAQLLLENGADPYIDNNWTHILGNKEINTCKEELTELYEKFKTKD